MQRIPVTEPYRAVQEFYLRLEFRIVRCDGIAIWRFRQKNIVALF